MLNSSPSRKRHERDGKEDLAGVQETRTIGSGLRGHSDDQIDLSSLMIDLRRPKNMRDGRLRRRMH